jgi:RNA polymerase sigma factor for flagellar operon FliA
LGVVFEAYARMRIRGAILDEIRKSQPLPRSVYSRRRELESSLESLRIELNRQPTEEEIATRIGTTVDGYRDLLDQLRPIIFVPLHQMLEGEDEFGGGGHEYNSADLNQEDPSEQAGRHELHELIRDRIQQLNRQQQKVLLLFYYEGLRMKDIAELMNVSESRVCQVNTEAILSLRAFLRRRERI